MSVPSDELLSAYLDGEIDAADHAAVETALREDPVLALRVLRIRRNDQALRAAVDAALGAPPAGLIAALAPPAETSNVVRLPVRPRGLTRKAATWAMPIAASLAVGLLVGRVMLPQAEPALVAASGSGMVAGPQLASVLSGAHSGEPQRISNGTVQVALSFQANSGELCRQFQAKVGADAAAGVACHNGQGWQLEDWSKAAAVAGDGYQTASGPDDPVISSELARLGVARVLDRAGESRAISLKWSAGALPARP